MPLCAQLKRGCKIRGNVDYSQPIFGAAVQYDRAGLFGSVQGDSFGKESNLSRTHHQVLVMVGIVFFTVLQHNQRSVDSTGELVFIGRVRMVDKRPRAVGSKTGGKA